MDRNRRMLIVNLPTGPLSADDFAPDEVPVRPPEEGEVVVETMALTIGAGQRAALQGSASYAGAPVAGRVMEATGSVGPGCASPRDRQRASQPAPGPDPDQPVHRAVHRTHPASGVRHDSDVLPVRVAATSYALFMHDDYPPFDFQPAADDDRAEPHASLSPYPEHLDRWKPLYKWFLAIPHYLVVAVLGIASVFAFLGGLVAVVATGVYPAAVPDFLVGVYRYTLRVEAYAGLLTDAYPQFRLAA